MTVQMQDILRVAARTSVQGFGDNVNVFHLRWDALTTATDEDAMDWCAERLEEAYKAIQPEIPNEVNFVDFNVFNVTQDRPLGSVPWPTLTSGGSSTETLPHQVAAFVRFPTGISRNWARKFIGPLSVDSSTSTGLIEPATLAMLGAFAAELIASTLSGGPEALTYVVNHINQSTWVPVVEAVVSNIWATVRTRRPGRGS